MTENNGNGKTIAAIQTADLYKTIAIAMAAVLVSVLGSWFAFGQNSVSASEVRNLIALNSPYAIDKAGIQQRLDSLTTNIDSLNLRIDKHLIVDTANQRELAKDNADIIELTRRVNRLEAQLHQ